MDLHCPNFYAVEGEWNFKTLLSGKLHSCGFVSQQGHYLHGVCMLSSCVSDVYARETSDRAIVVP